VLVIALGDSRAWSGSDAGGKAATVKVMAETGSWVPDVGYWAEDLDPEGVHHPLYNTQRMGDHWVQATSLPFVWAAVPLYEVAGFAGILAFPVLGSLLAAAAARRLARALGAATGWRAFWLVGLGTPALFYAGDFWEHAPALGFGMLAAALLAEDGGWPRALSAGLSAGMAALLRAEMLIYVAAFGLAVLAVGPLRRAWFQGPARLVAAGGGLALPLVINQVLERVVLEGAVRSTRAGAQVAEAGSELGQRLEDGLATTFALFPEASAKSYLAGALVMVGLTAAAWCAARRRAPSPLPAALVAAALALLLLRLVDGLGFVPGLVAAAPAAAAGLVVADPRLDVRPHARAVAVAAAVAIPVVWMFQWRGQLLPQWGGRYLLLSGLLLTAVGAAVLERSERRVLPGLVAAAAVAVSLSGAAWHAERTREVAGVGRALHAVPESTVLIADHAHLPRELGAFQDERRWLTARGRRQLAAAAGIARRSGATRVDLVRLEPRTDAPAFDGYRRTGRRVVDFLGFDLVVDRYEAP
jgi:hypothetical protein